MPAKKVDVPKRKKKTGYRSISDLMDCDPQGLTLSELRRLEEYKAKAAALAKIFTDKCKVCGKDIPEGWEYCGSEHRRVGEEDGQSKEDVREEKHKGTKANHQETL